MPGAGHPGPGTWSSLPVTAKNSVNLSVLIPAHHIAVCAEVACGDHRGRRVTAAAGAAGRVTRRDARDDPPVKGGGRWEDTARTRVPTRDRHAHGTAFRGISEIDVSEAACSEVRVADSCRCMLHTVHEYRPTVARALRYAAAPRCAGSDSTGGNVSEGVPS